MPTLLARNADDAGDDGRERRELHNAGLFARDGIIEQVGPTDELPVDAPTRCWICPGRSSCPAL